MNLYFSGNHYHLPAAVICPAEPRALPGFPPNCILPSYMPLLGTYASTDSAFEMLVTERKKAMGKAGTASTVWLSRSEA